jgi:hypothetical protein
MGDTTYSLGNCVFLQPNTKTSCGETKIEYCTEPVYIAQVSEIWTNTSGKLLFKGMRFGRGADEGEGGGREWGAAE